MGRVDEFPVDDVGLEVQHEPQVRHEVVKVDVVWLVRLVLEEVRRRLKRLLDLPWEDPLDEVWEVLDEREVPQEDELRPFYEATLPPLRAFELEEKRPRVPQRLPLLRAQFVRLL